MKYAVIQLGGKQFKVSEGDVIKTERQSQLNIDVLLYSSDGDILIGEPILNNVAVEATSLEEKLDKKIDVSRYRSKSRYRRKRGHRQPVSVLRIEKIGLASAKKPTSTEKKVEKSTKSTKSTKAASKTASKKAKKPTTSTNKKSSNKEEKK